MDCIHPYDLASFQDLGLPFLQDGLHQRCVTCFYIGSIEWRSRRCQATENIKSAFENPFHPRSKNVTCPMVNQIWWKGSAEDEIGDSAARFAKIRPMRVEMYLCVCVIDLRGRYLKK